MKRTILYRIASAIGLLMAFGAAAHAQTSEVTVQLGPDDVRPIGGASFDYEVVVDFPTGLYTDARVKAFLPVGITGGATGSPTSGEFNNAVYNATERSYTWIQQVPEIDVTEGSGVRKFTIEVSLPRYTTRDGQPFTFVATANGTLDGLPFPEATDDQIITGSGPGLALALGWNSSVGYGLGAARRWGLSDEPTPRPGWFGSLVMPVLNSGTGPTNAGATISAEVGAGYYVLSVAGSAGVTLAEGVTPYQRGGTWTGTRTNASTSTQIGYVSVAVFVPCDDFGKTPAEAAAAAADYASHGSFAASGTDYAGEVVTKSLVGGNITGPNLQTVCGSGGSFVTDFKSLINAGTRASWSSTTTPPAGATSITDAMMVDVLPPNASAFGTINSWGLSADFTTHYCMFSDLAGAHFSAAEFLARSATDCHPAWAPGDTHIVVYSPEWKANEDTGVMSAIGIEFYVDVSEAYSLAHIGETLMNRGYFNGTTIYGPRGDQDAANDAADVWQHAAASTAFPVDAGRLVIGVATNGRPTSPIDANDGAGVATWTFGNDAALRWPVNPSFSITAPPGIIITNFVFTAGATCETPVPAGVVPTAPFGSTIAFELGSEAQPWRIAPETCGGSLKVNFMVDRLYPFFDNQVVNFVVTGTVDNQQGPPTTLTTANTSTRIIVTTGMDVQLEGGCWTTPVEGVTPPQQGQVLFETTAINRGSEDLDAMELRFIVPPGAIYQSAFAGPDFPAGTAIEVSRDGGVTWDSAPAFADATVSDVRIAGFSIEGAGIDALRPSFYVAVKADDPSATITAKAWSETPTQGLGRTPEKELAIDAAQCRPACDCPDPTPNDACSTGGCDAEGACIQVDVEDQTSCTIPGDVCVTAAECQAGICTATATTTCNDADTCTGDRCDPALGCVFDDRYDCERERPFYFPVRGAKGELMGAVRCVVSDGKLRCDADQKGNVKLVQGASFCQ